MNPNPKAQASASMAFLLALAFSFVAVNTAPGQIELRVSVKFILDGNGNLPASGVINTHQEVRDQIDQANRILDGTGRGYRLNLTEIMNLAGVAQWFDLAVAANKDALESAAEDAPGQYAWRGDAINVYINGNNSSGVCSFPNTGEDIIFIGQSSQATTILHETGHYLNLCHTHGCTHGGGCADPGDDEVGDTLPDLPCSNQDNIAQNAFGVSYGSLAPAQQETVNDVFFNIMSYHGVRDRLTERQMDRLTFAANWPRRAVTNGRTVFVDLNNTCANPVGTPECLWFFGSLVGGPFPTVASGVDAASAASSNVVLIRPGTYREALTITKPVTLRATRAGTVTIGN